MSPVYSVTYVAGSDPVRNGKDRIETGIEGFEIHRALGENQRGHDATK